LQPKSLSCGYCLQEWAVIGQKIVETSFAITAAEKKAFETLREEVCTFFLPYLSKSQDPQVTTHTEDVRQNARIIDELDVALGFATLAAEMNFCRPTMTNEYAQPPV
jgi:DNA mismatch repair ATPase MutS